MDIATHQAWFRSYVAAKVRNTSRDPGPLLLKLEHTGNVLANAQNITDANRLDPDTERAALLAALYHDIARFDQYNLYGTFKDKDSRNHGAWSVKLLKQEKRLQEEKPEVRRMVLIAVGMHNRLAVPECVKGPTLVACNVVRDADKLDILRVMDEHLAKKPYNPTVVLGLPDDPELAGPNVLAAARARKSASYTDLRSVNDFRVLLGTWFFSMNFPASRAIFKQAGHARSVLNALPDNKLYREAKRILMGQLEGD